ncbi:beta-ketoacyl synthase chain length factor [Pantoea sp. R102]|uniref:beta-ketoacyl synthase chain length factor n=1 Tax=Pantoea sp. R102 TaxID=2507583 RepID=UPI0032B37F1A
MQLRIAVALLLRAGEAWRCTATAARSQPDALPQSLQFLHAMLSETADFTLAGERHQWRWERAHGG